MTDPTLATIAKDSPELLKAAGLFYEPWEARRKAKNSWYLDGKQGVELHSVEALLCWAMVKELWDNYRIIHLARGHNDDYLVDDDFADTPITALYAAYLAARGKP